MRKEPQPKAVEKGKIWGMQFRISHVCHGEGCCVKQSGRKKRGHSGTEEGTVSAPRPPVHAMKSNYTNLPLGKLAADTPPSPKAGVSQHPDLKESGDPTLVTPQTQCLGRVSAFL